MADGVPRRRRAWWRWLLAALLLHGSLGLWLTWPLSWPFDVLVNLGSAPIDASARVPAGQRHVVVLQHGLFRTAASLGRLERTLLAHGYEVCNPGYPSTSAPIEAHAEALASVIRARRAAGAVDRWSFVGHSMGGLVIQQYLRGADAVVPHACVYMGTPHRGALLADLRKHWFVFALAMGTTAAMQLSPGDPLHRAPIPWLDRSAVVVGDLGDGNASIPGPDDGTVAVDEAMLPGCAATLRLPHGHTRLAAAPDSLRATLHFLAFRAFPVAVGDR